MENSFEQTELIAAPAAVVWQHLTNFQKMKSWMGEAEMALEIETDWNVGSPIFISGLHHMPFRNNGRILRFEPGICLSYTHLSSVSRLSDEPMNYATVEFHLTSTENTTVLLLRVFGCPTESILQHLRFYWGTALKILKDH